MSHGWRAVDDRLLELSSIDAAIHLRTFWRSATDRAVVIGELADQGNGLLEVLPAVWRRLSRDVDLNTFRVYSFTPVAADPFRRHVSPNDVAGDRIRIEEVGPGRTRTSLASWRIDDGPVVDVWRWADYTLAGLASLLETSAAVRYDPQGQSTSQRSLRPRTGSPSHLLSRSPTARAPRI